LIDFIMSVFYSQNIMIYAVTLGSLKGNNVKKESYDGVSINSIS